MNNKSGSERGEMVDKIVGIIENLSTHILHYHDKEGRTTDEQVIHKARFREVAEAISAEFSHLQKLCEEQKGEIERLKNSLLHEHREIYFYDEDGEERQLEYVVGDGVEYDSPSGYMAKEPHPKIEQLESQISKQATELKQLQKDKDGLILDVRNWMRLNKRADEMLATQTERVRVLREALEKVSDVLDCLDTCPDCSSENRYNHEDYCRLFDAEQALNQDSLGDGK